MPVFRILLLLFVIGDSLWAADAPVIKAGVGMPVVQELMGGCSLTCSFPWNAADEADSAQKISALNDSDSLSAWTGVKVGERLVFKFPQNLPRELNGTPFYGVDIANGKILPESEYKDYGRIKSILLLHNRRPLYTIQLEDTRRWQHAEFDDVFLNVGDTLEIEVLEIYSGRKYPTAAITEIVLQGAH